LIGAMSMSARMDARAARSGAPCAPRRPAAAARAAPPACSSRGADAAASRPSPATAEPSPAPASRRALLAAGAAAALAAAAPPPPARAFERPPPGLRAHADKLDGYAFFYPEDWVPVTGSGADVFFRNPFDAEENLFVDVSSPSSSRYASVADLGPPAAAADALLKQFLGELMSTRLGVRREGEVVSATERTGADGRLYYDVELGVRSFASRNQLAVTQAERVDAVELEWDRRLLTVLGVAGGRLYSLRLQARAGSAARYREGVRSFRCYEVEV
jgi:hypothetical protein